MVLAGISGCTSGSSVAADCAMIFCGQDVSPDDTSKRVYVRSSRNCLQTKKFIFLGMMLFVQCAHGRC